MNSSQRIRNTYTFGPLDHLCRTEFCSGIWPEALEKWQREEGMPEDFNRNELFGYDEPGGTWLHKLGGTEPEFVPAIEEKVLEVTDEYEIARDRAGRTVKYFRGKRHGFMPQYLKHAVANDRDWEERVAPLLSPDTSARWKGWDDCARKMTSDASTGKFMTQYCIGGYMFLRSLVGPEEICLMLTDNPPLIHKMMQNWLILADSVTARVQQDIDLDELLLDEDICYNHGLLIGPDMIKEFLFPYYQQLLSNVRARQKRNKLYFHLATDGNIYEAIELYNSIGLDTISPIEIAAGNDVPEIAQRHPTLVISGGIDKRVLASGPEAIEEYLMRIIPPMVKRGGFIPTCDHGVPDNVSFANYTFYRKRILELDH